MINEFDVPGTWMFLGLLLGYVIGHLRAYLRYSIYLQTLDALAVAANLVIRKVPFGVESLRKEYDNYLSVVMPD